jgi:tetratricopeptide (TPR) repeat protein
VLWSPEPRYLNLKSDIENRLAEFKIEAVNHLKIADNYLTHIADKIPDDPMTARFEFLMTVQAATKHIQEARRLDPAAVYNCQDLKTNKIFLQSIGDMEARALYWEGFPKAEWSDNVEEINQGIQALLKALRYTPYSVQTNKALGRAYLRLGDHFTANKYFRAVLEIEPDNFEIHKLLDGIASGLLPAQIRRPL